MFALTLDRVSRLKYEPKDTERVEMKSAIVKQSYKEVTMQNKVVCVHDGKQKMTVGELFCKWQRSLHGKRKNTYFAGSKK